MRLDTSSGRSNSSTFDPNNLRLGNVVVDVYASADADCTGAATATLANQLLFAGPISSNSARATYTFQTVGTVSVALTPIVSARSGIYKYNSDFNTPPAGVSYTVPAPTNSVTLAKSVNIASNSVGNISVTYTITATNAGSAAVVLDQIINTLPYNPGAVTYTVNSTTVNSTAQTSFNPVNSGQTLTWGSTGSAGATFTVPTGGTLTLGFNAVIPAVNGVYTNSVMANINTTQLKITLTNSNAFAATDTYPALMLNTAAPASAISGAIMAAANGTSLVLSGGTLPAGGSCDIPLNVSSASAATGSQRNRVDRMHPDQRAASQRLGADHVHDSSRALRPTRQQRCHNHGNCGRTMPPISPADLNPPGLSRGKVECWDRSIARVKAASAHGAIGEAV